MLLEHLQKREYAGRLHVCQKYIKFIRKVCLNFLLGKLSRLLVKFSANFNAAIMLRFEWISMQTKKGGCLPGQIGLPHLGVGQDEKVPKEPSEVAQHLWLLVIFSNIQVQLDFIAET